METMMDKLEEWVHHHIPSEGMARDVIDILTKRWGWQVTISDMNQWEIDYTEDMVVVDEDIWRGDR